MAPLAPRSGDSVHANVERVNAELFTLTYGAMVRQQLTDIERVEEVNKQLDQMGYSIGIWLIDEFIAISNVAKCVDFKETTNWEFLVYEVAFKGLPAKDIEKTWLVYNFIAWPGVTATVTNWNSEGTSCSIILEDNPLVDFVELPDTCQGVMKTEVTCVREMLHGDDAYELQVELLQQVPEEYPYKDDE